MRVLKSTIRSFLLAASCTAATVSNPVLAADKITVGLVTPVSLTSAPFTFGEQLGYFREEGIEVELLPFNGTGTLVPQMTAKRIDVGYPNPDFLILARQPGKDYLPLRFFYNVARESIWEITVPAASPYQSLRDLKGTKMGVVTLSQGSIPITRAMFKDIGLEIGKDVELIAVGSGATVAQALNGKQVEVLNVFDTINGAVEASGVKLRRLPMDKKYLNLFSNGYIAHDDTLKTRGKQLAAFGRAWTKSVVACDAAMDSCMRSFWKAYPTQKPQGDADQALATQVTILKSRMSKLTAFEGPDRQYGAYPEQAWRDFIGLLHEQGQIANADIQLNTLYTNELVPEFNKFDAAKVVADAKAAKP